MYYQVVLDTVGSGVVVITVTGFAIQTPLGPQNYSLAVQGSFSGELESRYNPGWGGATTASCRLPITRITSGPATISNASAVSIFFNASEGVAQLLSVLEHQLHVSVGNSVGRFCNDGCLDLWLDTKRGS